MPRPGCRISEELFLRLAVLEDVIGTEALQVLKNAVQSDLDQVSRLARAMAAGSTARQNTDGHDSTWHFPAFPRYHFSIAVSPRIEDLESRIVEEEALKLAALESNRVLQHDLPTHRTVILPTVCYSTLETDVCCASTLYGGAYGAMPYRSTTGSTTDRMVLCNVRCTPKVLAVVVPQTVRCYAMSGTARSYRFRYRLTLTERIWRYQENLRMQSTRLAEVQEKLALLDR
eukprot:606367-Rhodomonas_salina.2